MTSQPPTIGISTKMRDYGDQRTPMVPTTTRRNVGSAESRTGAPESNDSPAACERRFNDVDDQRRLKDDPEYIKYYGMFSGFDIPGLQGGGSRSNGAGKQSSPAGPLDTVCKSSPSRATAAASGQSRAPVAGAPARHTQTGHSSVTPSETEGGFSRDLTDLEVARKRLEQHLAKMQGWSDNFNAP